MFEFSAPDIPIMQAVVFDCTDPQAVGRFWAEVLDTEIGHDDPDFVVLRRHGDRNVGLAFQRVPDPTPGKNRVHVDLAVQDKDAAAQRAARLGGTIVGEHEWHGGWTWIVVADPEGNQFCLVQAPAEAT